MKHLKRYKIFESSTLKSSLDFEHIRDLFLHRDFEDVIELRDDIRIFDDKVDLTLTPSRGIYLIFENCIDSVRIKFLIFNVRDYSNPLGDESALIKDLEVCYERFAESLSKIGLDVIIVSNSVKRNPFDFEIYYNFSLLVR